MKNFIIGGVVACVLFVALVGGAATGIYFWKQEECKNAWDILTGSNAKASLTANTTPPNPKVDPKVDPKDAKADPKVDPKADPATDPKVDPKDAKADPKVDPKADPAVDPKLDPKAAKVDPKIEPKAEPKDPKVDPKLAKADPKIDPKATAPKLLDPKDFVSKAEYEENKKKVGEKFLALKDDLDGRITEVENVAKAAKKQSDETNKRVDVVVSVQNDQGNQIKKNTDEIARVDKDQKENDKANKAAHAALKTEVGSFKVVVEGVVVKLDTLLSEARKAVDKGNVTQTTSVPVNITINQPAGLPERYEACPKTRTVYGYYPIPNVHYALPAPAYAYWYQYYFKY